MTQEEKARAYDKVSKEVKDFFEGRQKMYSDVIQTLEYLFPELKESEDEKIRKALLNYLTKMWGNSQDDICGVHVEDVIAWLEKQGDKLQGKSALEAINEEKIDNQNCVKLADNAEPKFKVGDTIINIYHKWAGKSRIREITDGKYIFDEGSYINITEQDNWELVSKNKPKFNKGSWITNGEDVWQIDEVKTENYLLIDSEGTLFAEEIAKIDSEFHLWTIQDAKDGDVLASKDKLSILIFRNLDTSTSFSSYYNIEGKGELGWSNECFIPATKEQRNVLFSKMKEAGYEWDAEKKEPRKIKQKPIDKVETKFNAGDWVVNKLGDVWHIDSIDNKNYQVSDGKGNYNYFPISKQDEMHLWTIADAKEGNVLSVNWDDDDDFWEKIIIFKKYHNKGVEGLFNTPCVEGYGNTFKNGKLALCEEVPYYSKTWTTNLQPATKEQRDTLMKAMADAGYEWDNNKKELKKTSQRMISAEAKEALYDKLSWSEEDNYGFDCVAQCITQATLSSNNKQDLDICKCARNWINSIKQRLTNT